MKAGWIIDVDVLYLDSPQKLPNGTNANAFGLTGPSDYDGDGSDCIYPFTMHDDDGYLYYIGRSNRYGSMLPLDNFGRPNAGATEIRYWSNANNKWETL